jgi:uncharacterized metal-binding protein
MTAIDTPTCSECHQLHCYRQDKRFPDFCATVELDQDERQRLVSLYQGDGRDAAIARAAAEVEGLYYGKINRVEETIAFARRIDVRLIGIATCFGLVEETRTLVKILRLAGFDTVAALCKIGSIDKTEIGINEDLKIKPGGFEACCNPVLQAHLMNKHKTDLNLIMGLCVGHDILFTKHSDAPVSTMVVKDRVLGHNPVAALYTTRSYNSRLLDEKRLNDL